MNEPPALLKTTYRCPRCHEIMFESDAAMAFAQIVRALGRAVPMSHQWAREVARGADIELRCRNRLCPRRNIVQRVPLIPAELASVLE